VPLVNTLDLGAFLKAAVNDPVEKMRVVGRFELECDTCVFFFDILALLDDGLIILEEEAGLHPLRVRHVLAVGDEPGRRPGAVELIERLLFLFFVGLGRNQQRQREKQGRSENHNRLRFWTPRWIDRFATHPPYPTTGRSARLRDSVQERKMEVAESSLAA